VLFHVLRVEKEAKMTLSLSIENKFERTSTRMIYLSLMSQKDQMTTSNDLDKKDYQATVNCRIPPSEPRSTGRQSP